MEKDTEYKSLISQVNVAALVVALCAVLITFFQYRVSELQFMASMSNNAIVIANMRSDQCYDMSQHYWNRGEAVKARNGNSKYYYDSSFSNEIKGNYLSYCVLPENPGGILTADSIMNCLDKVELDHPLNEGIHIDYRDESGEGVYSC